MKTRLALYLLMALCFSNLHSMAGDGAGTALRFDGTNDYVLVPGINLNGTNSLSVEAWVKPANLSATAFSEIIRQQYEGAVDWLLAFQSNGTLLTFGLRLDGTYQELRVTVTPGDFIGWHHVAATYNGTNVILYRDGIPIGSNSRTGNLTTSSPTASIGALYDLAPSEFFNGDIDEIRIWKTARTAAQIKSAKGQTVAPGDPALAAYWRFDDGSGLTATDSTGTGHNGTLNNGPLWIISTAPIGISLVETSQASNISSNSATFQGFVNPNGFDGGFFFEYGTTTNYGNTTGPVYIGNDTNFIAVSANVSNLLAARTYHFRLVATNTAGISFTDDKTFYTFGPEAGYALSFDGINDFVNSSPLNVGGLNAFSIEAWIKPVDITNTAFSHLVRQQGTTTTFLLAFQTNGTLLSFGLRVNNTFQELRVPINASDYTDGNWHHIAATFDGTTKRIYKDGELLGSGNQPGTITPTTNGTFTIAAAYNGVTPTDCFNGLIDEVRLWRSAQSIDQLNQDLNNGLLGDAPNLLVYWRLDEGTGTLIADTSGHGFSGTLINGPQWVSSTSPVLPYAAPPVIFLQTARNATNNTVDLTTSVHPSGLPTTVYFDYGPSSNYGNQTAPVSLSNTAGATGITNSITFPSPVTPYHWRVVAFNSEGTNFGVDHTFFTAGPGPGASIKLDGQNDNISIPPLNPATFSGLTLEAWIKPAALTNTTYSEVIRQQGSGTTTDWLLSFQNKGSVLSFGLRTDATMQELQVPINPLTYADGSWHHVAATYDGTFKKIYVDGIQIGSMNQSGSLPALGRVHYIGSFNGSSEFFNGQIDEVRIWNTARNSAELNQFMSRGLSGSESGLIAYWRFDEGSGNSSLDSSLHGNTASLLNGAGWGGFDVPLIPTNGLPIVVVGSSTNITTSTATLLGSVNPNGAATQIYFEYGLTTNYGSATPPINLPSAFQASPVSATISSLQPTKLYNYRLVAVNAAGTTYGTNRTFFTFGTGAGYALSFDGVNDHVGLPAVNLNGTNALTLEAWIKPSNITTPNYCEIIRQTGFSVNDWLLAFQNNGTFLSFGLTTTAGFRELRVPVNPAYFTDGSWHHVAASYDGGTKRLFVDGILVGATNQSGPVVTGGSSHSIGSSGSNSEFFVGLIDEVRFWSVARSPAQIAQFMGQNLVGTEAGLVGYWRFDEGSGLTAGDSSGQGRNGTLINGPLWVTSTAPVNLFAGPPFIDHSLARTDSTNSAQLVAGVLPGGLGATVHFEYGVTTNYGMLTGPVTVPASSSVLSITNTLSSLQPYTLYHWRVVASNDDGTVQSPDHTMMLAETAPGMALSFDGINDCLSFSPINLSGSTGFCVEAWIKPANLTSAPYADIIRQTGSGAPDYLVMFQGNGTTLAFGLKTSTGYQELRVAVNPANFTDGKWHHIAGTYDGGSKRLYVDAIQIGQGVQTGNPVSTGTILTIGNSTDGGPPSEFFNGQMDEVRVWNITRTHSQISDNMNRGLSGSENGLTAYWRFEEGSGLTTGDSSGNFRTGTLLNGPIWVNSLATIYPFVDAPSIGRNYTDFATTTSAKLIAAVSPGALTSVAYFEYGFTTNYGSRSEEFVISPQSPSSQFTNTLDSLSPNQIYHWRVVATNDLGTSYGSDKAFASVAPEVNSALAFDGVNDSVAVPPVNVSTTDKLTLEAWVLPSYLGSTPFSAIIRQQAAFNTADYNLSLQTNGSFLTFGLTAGGDYRELRTPLNTKLMRDGSWHHVAAVYDGSTKTIYLDGTPIASTNQTGLVGTAGAASTTFIGSYGGTADFFIGAIDEVRVWNSALTQQQLRQNMNFIIAGDYPSLQAYWRFDEGSGTNAFDFSGNNHTGTLKNGPAWINPAAPVVLFAPPAIGSFTPLSGAFGTQVSIFGWNFTTVTNVSFNGTSAPFIIVSDTNITATVPIGSVPGPITISNLYGQTNGIQNFIVDNDPPVLSFLTPANGTFVTSLSQISGFVSDLSGISNFALYIQRASDAKFWTGSSWGMPTALPVNLSGNNWSRTSQLPTGFNLLEGSYSIFIFVMDNAGNSSDLTSRVTVNKTGPVTAITLHSNGHALLRFPGGAGQTYRLEASTNLVDWITLQTITVGASGILEYEDVNTTNHVYRFFRTVIP